MVGHSFGGRITGYLGTTNPIWLNSLTIYAGPCIFRPSLKVRTQTSIARVTKKILPKTLIDKIKSDELLEADQNNLGKIYRNAVNFDITDRLKFIDKETTIIWGTEDKETPIAIGREMNRLIPDSKFVEIPKEGHNIHLDNPNLFYGILKNILSSYDK